MTAVETHCGKNEIEWGNKYENALAAPPFTPTQMYEFVLAKREIMKNSNINDVLVFVGNSASYFYYTFSKIDRECIILPASGLSYMERGDETRKEPDKKQYDAFCKKSDVDLLYKYVTQKRKIIVIDHSGTGESVIALRKVLIRCHSDFFVENQLHFINLVDFNSTFKINKKVLGLKLFRQNIIYVCSVISSSSSGFFNNLFNDNISRLVPYYPIHKWGTQVDNVKNDPAAAKIIHQLQGLQHTQKGGIGPRCYTVARASAGNPGGRYTSKSGPAAAAKKAASKRFGVKSTVRVTLRELGSDSEFTYDATRVKLPNPIVRKIAGVTVASKYRIDVKAVRR